MDINKIKQMNELLPQIKNLMANTLLTPVDKSAKKEYSDFMQELAEDLY